VPPSKPVENAETGTTTTVAAGQGLEEEPL